MCCVSMFVVVVVVVVVAAVVVVVVLLVLLLASDEPEALRLAEVGHHASEVHKQGHVTTGHSAET